MSETLTVSSNMEFQDYIMEPYAENVSFAVKNIGNGKVVCVASMSVTMRLNRRRFTEVNQVQTFTVTIASKNGQLKKRITEGQLKWVDRRALKEVLQKELNEY